jgi:two-component system chemotaxis sensor kinase CheA
VKELIRTGRDAEHRVEMLHDTRVLRLRDRLLPLLGLGDFLELAHDGSPGFVVVMEVGGRQFGVAVDDVFDTEEIVVKPLAQMLRDVAAFSGATILGDGSVVLILDPNTLAQAVGELKGEAGQPQQQSRAATSDEVTSMLLIRAGDSTPKAVPLALVTAAGGHRAEAIERSSGRRWCSTGQALARAVRRPSRHTWPATASSTCWSILAMGIRVMGLAVDQIVDIVEEKLALQAFHGGTRRSRLGLLKGAQRTSGRFGLSTKPSRMGSTARPPMRPLRRLAGCCSVDDSAFLPATWCALCSRRPGYEVTTGGLRGGGLAACTRTVWSSTPSSPTSRCPRWTASASPRN